MHLSVPVARALPPISLTEEGDDHMVIKHCAVNTDAHCLASTVQSPRCPWFLVNSQNPYFSLCAHAWRLLCRFHDVLLHYQMPCIPLWLPYLQTAMHISWISPSPLFLNGHVLHCMACRDGEVRAGRGIRGASGAGGGQPDGGRVAGRAERAAGGRASLYGPPLGRGGRRVARLRPHARRADHHRPPHQRAGRRAPGRQGAPA